MIMTYQLATQSNNTSPGSEQADGAQAGGDAGGAVRRQDAQAGRHQGHHLLGLQRQGGQQRQELHRLQGAGGEWDIPIVISRIIYNVSTFQFRVHMQQMGPGMISQSQEVCGECEGRGEVIPPSSRCKSCKGKKTTKDKKVIEIQIDKGAPSDFRKVFYGEVTWRAAVLARRVLMWRCAGRPGAGQGAGGHHHPARGEGARHIPETRQGLDAQVDNYCDQNAGLDG